jgi:hypothetical protein
MVQFVSERERGKHFQLFTGIPIDSRKISIFRKGYLLCSIIKLWFIIVIPEGKKSDLKKSSLTMRHPGNSYVPDSSQQPCDRIN